MKLLLQVATQGPDESHRYIDLVCIISVYGEQSVFKSRERQNKRQNKTVDESYV